MIELSDEEGDVLRRLLRSLKGAEGEFIVAGGQAARLLRLHPLARQLEWSPLLTHDVDVAMVAQAGRVLATLTKKQLQKLIENAGKLGDANTDFVVEASRLAAGRVGLHTAPALALANRLGLEELLGRSSSRE